MITFDFDYYKPETVEEAVSKYLKLNEMDKAVLYYAGGTEIINLARLRQEHFEAVIDIKGIPEMNLLEFQKDKLVIGAAVSLSDIYDFALFPLLGSVCRQAADRTARNKITLGGNLCGRTPYREAVLPLLLADSEISIAGASGLKRRRITELFDKSLKLENGEIIVQVYIDKEYLKASYVNIKKTRQEKLGYPLITAAALKKGNLIRVAFSGLCSYPFRSEKIEKDFNNEAVSIEQRLEKIIKHLPETPVSDALGSAGYREFLACNALSEIDAKLGGVKCS